MYPRCDAIVSVVILGGSLLSARMAQAGELVLPSIMTPPFAGRHYGATVPDTFDLAERMRLSVNGFTRAVSGPPENPFPRVQYRAQHFINIAAMPPTVTRSIPLYGKYMLGLLMDRIVTGSDQSTFIDDDWRQGWLDWARINPVPGGPEGGRRLEWLAFNIQREDEPNRSAWIGLAERAVKRIKENSAPYRDSLRPVPPGGSNMPDNGCTCPEEAMSQTAPPGTTLTPDPDPEKGRPLKFDASFISWTVQGLCAVHRATGNDDALMLAGKYARYLKDYSETISPDGRLQVSVPGVPAVHFHHSAQTALACAEYGFTAKDDEFLEFARKVYEHLLTFCSRETGFAPEWCYGTQLHEPGIETGEACCTSDLILLALWLTLSGTGDYWDDIDRYLRNQLAELQMINTRWAYNTPENRGKWTYPDPVVEEAVAPYVGHFAGWATLNEWHRSGYGIMTCCIGNSNRAMYYTWRHMVTFHRRALRVNLLLNHASPYADVFSYQPYEGRVTIKLKRRCRQVLIRAPEWIPGGSESLVCAVNGKQRRVRWKGRYAKLGPAKVGDLVTMEFPIEVRQIKAEIGRQDFTLTIKGSTVIAVDPPGQRIPLYQRERYKADKAPLIQVTRFVSDRPPR